MSDNFSRHYREHFVVPLPNSDRLDWAYVMSVADGLAAAVDACDQPREIALHRIGPTLHLDLVI